MFEVKHISPIISIIKVIDVSGEHSYYQFPFKVEAATKLPIQKKEVKCDCNRRNNSYNGVWYEKCIILCGRGDF
jgi:hypothetical protein